MSSIIKVNTFQDANGNALFSSDGSGNVTLSAGAMKNTPAFEAYLSADQSISNNTATKINWNAERFDIGSVYDTSSYRFTIPSGYAGKYHIYSQIMMSLVDSATLVLYLYKNGSQILVNEKLVGALGNRDIIISTTVDCAVGDYFEMYCYQNTGVSKNIESEASNNGPSLFGAYKLIGA